MGSEGFSVAAVFKSMLVAAALSLVGFGAAGEAWARCFEQPPNRWLIDKGNGPKTVETSKFVPDRSPISVEAKLFAPDQAFADHVWVNSTLVQAPKYVDAPNARLTLEEKAAEAAAAARRLILMKESRASAAKRAAAAAQVAASRGGSPRFKFQVPQCGFDSGKRDASGNYPVPVLPTGGWNNPLGVSSPRPGSSSAEEPNSVSQPCLKNSAPASSLDGH